MSIEDVQAQLSPDEALILIFDTPEWNPTPEESFLWAITTTDAGWAQSDVGTQALRRQVATLRCGLDASWDDAAGRSRCRHLVGAAPDKSNLLPFDNGGLANLDILQAQCPLPETSFELKCVAQSLGAPPNQIQVREKATATAVETAPLDRYQIVYFATHGLLASETKQATGTLADPALLLTPPQRGR